MGKSYKKTPIVKEHKSGKFGKKRANKKVRKSKGLVGKSKLFKKKFDSWDIQDYAIYVDKDKLNKNKIRK